MEATAGETAFMSSNSSVHLLSASGPQNPAVLHSSLVCPLVQDNGLPGPLSVQCSPL